MRLEPTENYELITTIMKSMWDCASEDDTDIDDYQEGPEPNSGWLLILDDENVMGAIFVHQTTSSVVQLHPYMLKEYRPLFRAVMGLFFEWFCGLPDQVIKLACSIPFCSEKVYNAAKRVGFIDEGVSRQSYRKHGKVWNQWNLGLTREEIKGLCDE